jgi:hypothetical protein
MNHETTAVILLPSPRRASWTFRHPGLTLLAGSLALLQGCATLQSWFKSAGTYAVAAPTSSDLSGQGEVHGTLYLTPAPPNVMMEGREPPPVAGLLTTVAVEPVGLAIVTDPQGQLVLPGLEPGEYRLAFSDPDDREIWVEFAVEAGQRLDVVVWVQWDGPTQGRMSEGTTPMGMFPGAGGFYGLSSGDSGRSSGGERGGGSGGGPG